MNGPDRPAQSQRILTKDVGRPTGPTGTVAVEIGFGFLHLVWLKRRPDQQIVFEKCRTVEFDVGLALDSPQFGSLLKTTLKKFCGSSKDLAIWAMPELDRVRIHNLKVPQVSPARLPGAVFWALQREESFLEKETVVDFQVVAQSESRNHLTITGAVVDRGCIETLQLGFSQAGFPLTGLGIPLLALGNLVNLRSDNENETPVLVCQMGQRATSVSVLHNRRLVFTRNIPLGLQTLTDALVKELEPAPTKEEACALILKPEPTESEASGEAIDRTETVRNLLRPILARTARQIERTIEYYQSNFDTEPMEKIFLGGEIAARGHLFHLISGQLSLETIAIDPFDTPVLHANGTIPSDPGERTAFGPAFGLALEGARDGLNLAHTYKDRQRESRLDKIGAAAILALILVTGVATFFTIRNDCN